MSTSRRTFLKQSSLIAAGTALAPYFINGLTAPLTNFPGRRLVPLHPSVGNAAFSTVVPVRCVGSVNSRPQIAVMAGWLLTRDDELGVHPAMEGLRGLYDGGLLTVLKSVGYPNPDRSHLRSMDIWHTASQADENWTTGRLGR